MLPVLIVITLNLYLLSKPGLSVVAQNPLLSLSQMLSLVGSVLLSLTFILSSRLTILEKFFGPLDKIYKLHHLLGGISFALLLHHPILLAIRFLPSASTYFLLGNNLYYNFGIIALYLMVLLLIFTLLINLPYQLWLLTHQFMGLSLLFASLHVFFIDSDVARYLPLRLWILFWLALALTTYIIKKFFYQYFVPHYQYLVDKITQSGDFTDIYLKPTSVPIKFSPGQFAFFKIKNESHPFSFASSPSDKSIRICVKNLGDFTSTLRDLKINEPVSINGPFGNFGQNFYQKTNVVAIAGGVGITPFLSLFQSIPDNSSTSYHFFNAYNSVDFFKIQPKSSHFTYHPWDSQQHSRLTASDIQEVVPEFLRSTFYLCGPYQMMIGLRDQLMKLGIPQRAIIFEDFNLK